MNHRHLLPSLATALLGASLLATICCGERSVAESPGVVTKSVVLFIFDPTILNPNEVPALKELLDRLAEFYVTIPENSHVAVFLVDKGISQKPPLEDITFGVDQEFGGEERHGKELKEQFLKLRPRLEAAWNVAHNADAVKLPTSCIASSLYAANQYLERYAHDGERYRFFLVLVSDMMESCDEWSKPINLERGTGELDSLRQISMIDLSKLTRAVVVQVPNNFLVTPMESEALNASWHSVFERSGVKSEAIAYSSSFPIDFEFGSK